MKTRSLTICVALCLAQGIMAQHISLGLADESSIYKAVSEHGINRPFMNYIPQIGFIGDELYVATPKGLFVKNVSDNSLEWNKLSVTDTLVVDFAVRGDTMSVLTCDTLYLSTDRGRSYSTTPLETIIGDDPYDSRKLYHVSLHPNDARRIYVAYQGVSHSSDFGKSWQKLPDRIEVSGFGMSYAPVGVLYNPNDPTNMIAYCNIAAYNGSDLFYSCDAGASWSISFFGESIVSEIYRVAFHPTDKNKMIVCGLGTYLMQEQQGQRLENIYRPDDRYQSNLLVNLYDVIYDTRNPNILYGADIVPIEDKNIVILRSTDGGLSWEEFYRIECKDYDYASRLAIKDNMLAIYSYASGIYLLDVDAVETSVPTIEKDISDTPYYDLQGRKVANPTRGIYIKDGKKVILK